MCWCVMVAMGYVLVVVGCASVDVLSGGIGDGYWDWQVGVWMKVQSTHSRSTERKVSMLLC